MTQPFAFAARETPNVRGYSIGPHHVDWLCVKCGATGCIEATAPFASSWEWQCVFAATEQVNPRELERARLIELGQMSLRLRSERALFAHLQGHVRFESIERTEPDNHAKGER